MTLRKKDPVPLSHDSGKRGFDDAGHKVPITDFDYGLVDCSEPETDLTELTPREMSAALKAMRVILEWIFQDGMKNPDGLKIRAIIACWVLLEWLRPLTETQMANGFGLEKQSLGRWVVEWKKKFPALKIPHFREGKPRKAHEQD